MFEESEDQTLQLVTLIGRYLVDDIDALEVHRTMTTTGGVTLHVTCASGDLGKLVGKQGRTARSLRTILAAVSAKYGTSYSLDLKSMVTEGSPCSVTLDLEESALITGSA